MSAPRSNTKRDPKAKWSECPECWEQEAQRLADLYMRAIAFLADPSLAEKPAIEDELSFAAVSVQFFTSHGLKLKPRTAIVPSQALSMSPGAMDGSGHEGPNPPTAPPVAPTPRSQRSVVTASPSAG